MTNQLDLTLIMLAELATTLMCMCFSHKVPHWYTDKMISEVKPYFFLFFDAAECCDWGGVAAASLRGLPRSRLSGWAGLPVEVAPALLEGGEGPWSEVSTVLSSDDILEESNDRGW